MVFIKTVICNRMNVAKDRGTRNRIDKGPVICVVNVRVN